MKVLTGNGPDLTELVPVVVARCRAVLGEQSTWINPTGYPDSLARCLIDAIWSLGVNYDQHVVPVLDRYREARRAVGGDPRTDGTAELLATIAGVGGPGGFAKLVQNRQRTSTRAGAPLKAKAVTLAAQALSAAGITNVVEFRRALANEGTAVRSLWKALPGQRSSDIGWRYMHLLAGEDAVKPDRMIGRFLAACGACELTPADMATVVGAVASKLGVPARVLDHAIWRFQRAVPKGSTVNVS